jgi:hypothetical protein
MTQPEQQHPRRPTPQAIFTPEEFAAGRTRAEGLRRLCIHEAGHAHVSRQYGLNAECVVFRRAEEREEVWEGRTDCYGECSRSVDRLIGLAGVVATSLDEGPMTHYSEIAEALEWGDLVLSAQDAELAAGYRECDIEDCITLISAYMPSIIREAEAHLASLEVMTHGVVGVYHLDAGLDHQWIAHK